MAARQYLIPIASLLNGFTITMSFIICPLIPDDFDRGFGCSVTQKQCPNEGVTFWLYTRETQNDPHQLDLSRPETIRAEHFQQDAPLVLLIHGYTGHKDFSPNTEIRPAYFADGEYNIISVDYGPLAPKPCYFSGVKNLPTVANCTAMLLDYMADNDVYDMGYYHVIGFSLGGQTAGMISNYLHSTRISRITALDPAKPCFIDAPDTHKVDSTDADFVDVIHTDVFARGMLSPLGHADFYVNGGFNQPGCLQNLTEFGSCNHARAPAYYAESISSEEGFWGYECEHWYDYVVGLCREQEDNYAIMGKSTPNTTRGLYFVSTNHLQPFAKGRMPSADNYFKQYLAFVKAFSNDNDDNL